MIQLDQPERRGPPAPLMICALATIFLNGFLARSSQAQEGQADEKPVTFEKEVLLPPDVDELNWRWEMRLASLGPSNNGTRNELNSYETIEKRIKELAEDGYNAIICNGLHFHLCFLDRWKMWQGNMKKIVEVAHKHNMKVVEHYDVPVVYYAGTGYDYLLKHLGWLERDVRYDYPTFHAMCLNNPGFRKEYLARLEDSVRKTKIDGVMLDECTFSGPEFCGCGHCRQKFAKDAGYVLPTDDSSEVFFDRSSPLWVTWLKWRIKSNGDWWVDVRKTLNKVNPHMSILTYTTHYGFTNRWAALSFGAELTEKARACDFLGTEIMTRNAFDCYRSVFAFRKIKSALGNHFNSPIFGLVYHMDDENFAHFGWALCRMNRQTTWMSTIERADMKRYIDWPLQMKNRFAEPMADIAILFSTYSRNWNKLLGHLPDALGYSQCLSDAHVQHDFIMDDDVRSENLRRYKLLILPSAGCMSARQVKEIEKYVSDGGTIIVSGHSSLYNEDGFGGENYQLADVTGVDYVEGFIYEPTYVRRRADSFLVTFPLKALKVKVRDADRSEVLADVLDDKKRPVSPAIVATDYGKGRSIYLANRLGAVNYERELMVKKEWTFEANTEAADLLVDVVKTAAQDSFIVKEVNIPQKVLLSVYRQNHQGKKNILVHLLNATGVNIKKGDILPGRKIGEAFPPLKEDIVFDIRLDEIAHGYIASPDYEGTREIQIEKQGNGYCRITIPGQTVKAYAMAYLGLD